MKNLKKLIDNLGDCIGQNCGICLLNLDKKFIICSGGDSNEITLIKARKVLRKLNEKLRVEKLERILNEKRR